MANLSMDQTGESDSMGANPHSSCPMPQNNASGMYTLIPDDSEGFTWTKNSTRLLVEEYRRRGPRFKDSSIKKKDLWTEIKDVFVYNGINVTEDMLDRKFRNLKKTFISIYSNNKRPGKGRVTWEYYDKFLEIFEPEMASGTMRDAINSFKIPLDVQIEEGQADAFLKKHPVDRNKGRMLEKQREELLKLERERIRELQLIRRGIERSNLIQEQRNITLQVIADHFTKKQCM